jgi:hypothetical protein
MTAFEYLKYLKANGIMPGSKEGSMLGLPSNSEMRRWLAKGSVLINSMKPQPNDEVEFPIAQLIFFNGSKSQTTIVRVE